MIARHLGLVVLVREVVEPSPDRRAAGPAGPTNNDPLCGGALYSHIAYNRQLAIKSDVIRDAFGRLGRYPIDRPIEVAGSPEEGYRMRARFHVQGARAGFYREG